MSPFYLFLSLYSLSFQNYTLIYHCERGKATFYTLCSHCSPNSVTRTYTALQSVWFAEQSNTVLYSQIYTVVRRNIPAQHTIWQHKQESISISM